MSSMCVTWVNIEIFNVFQGRYTLSAFINIKIVHEHEDVDKNQPGKMVENKWSKNNICRFFRIKVWIHFKLIYRTLVFFTSVYSSVLRTNKVFIESKNDTKIRPYPYKLLERYKE